MPNVLIHGFARHIHERAELIIKEEIFTCDTSLIFDLIGEAGEIPSTANISFSLECIENYFDRPIEAIDEFISECPDIDDSGCDFLTLEEKLSTAEDHGFEIKTKFIYQYWRVSLELAEGLVNIGEPVMWNQYGAWWGRTRVGELIKDGAIQSVVLEREGKSS